MKHPAWVFVLALIFGISSLWGCSSTAAQSDVSTLTPPATEAPVAAQPKYTIALVMKTLTNPFFVEMEKGARQAEQELDIELLVKTGAQETSIEQQISIIENLTQGGVDAIVIAPADSRELIPVLKEAQDTGMIIINIDNQLDPLVSEQLGLTGVPYISVDNEQGAYLSANYLSSFIEKPTDAVILEGITSAKNAQDRRAGAERAFQENPNITLVATETANWKIDEAYEVVKELYEDNPNIGAIFASNDMMAFGVLRYLEENDKTNVIVTAYDALAEAKEAIKAGQLYATIDQQAALQGYTGVQYAVRALNGQELPPVTLVDVSLITKENIEQ